MRFIFTAFLFMSSLSLVFSQTADALTEKVIKIIPRDIVKYTVKEKPNVVFLETGFNDAVYRDQKNLLALKGKVIVKIELIYTTYRKSETFDQHGLNRKRLKALFAAAPNVLSQPGIEWVLLAQSGCTSAEMGKEFFHGVVITTREAPSAALTDAELDFLEAVADGKIPVESYDAYIAHELNPDTTTASLKQPKITLPNFAGGERTRIDYFTRNLKYPSDASATGSTDPEQVTVQFIVDKTGKIKDIVFPDVLSPTAYHDAVMKFVKTMPAWNPGRINDKNIDCVVSFSVDFMTRGTVVASPLEIYALEAPTPKAPPYDYTKIKPTPQGKFVAETLAKNKWKNAVLVCDVTGSMAPYNAQMLSWLKNQFTAKDTAIVRFVFFNDGNNRKDISKRIGMTGGLYSFKPATFDEVLQQLGTAMKAGGGGDLDENNLEALLKAEADCPSCECTVMIADNYATPRDLSLTDKLTKPVNIIVCGNGPILNEAYLDLARATKGSVQFGGKSYTNLHTFEEGSTLQVAKSIFTVKKGKFVLRSE